MKYAVCRLFSLCKHFNRIIQEQDCVIKFILYAIFGSTEELGFDLTVERISIKSANGNTLYDFRYTVNDEIYQTIGNPLSEKAAHRIVSRATRVWQVKRYLGDDEEGNAILSQNLHALKDVWLPKMLVWSRKFKTTS